MSKEDNAKKITLNPEIVFKIKDNEFHIVNDETKKDMDAVITSLLKKAGDVKDIVKKDSDLYNEIIKDWDNMDNALKRCKFNLYLNKTERDFIKTKINYSKTSINVDTINIVYNIIDNLKKMVFKNDEDLQPLYITTVELTIIYHILKETEIKGYNSDLYTFTVILERIGMISKLANYYDNQIKEITDNKKLLITDRKPNTTIEKTFKEKNITYNYIDDDVSKKIDDDINDILDYIKNNNGRGESEEKKNDLYKTIKEKWDILTDDMKDMHYNMYIKKDMCAFLLNQLTVVNVYNETNVFSIIELSDLLKLFKENSNKDMFSIKVTAKDISNLFNCLSNYNCKLYDTNTYTYINIIESMSKICNIIDYYNKMINYTSNMMTTWLTLFDENVTADNI